MLGFYKQVLWNWHDFFKWQLVTYKTSISIHVEGEINFKFIFLTLLLDLVSFSGQTVDCSSTHRFTVILYCHKDPILLSFVLFRWTESRDSKTNCFLSWRSDWQPQLVTKSLSITETATSKSGKWLLICLRNCGGLGRTWAYLRNHQSDTLLSRHMYYMHVTNVSALMCTKALMTKVN